ncbi:hypothetical protein [Paenibacillus elgii]|uniref:hypothetical protein n=1 Tax=Paenibacillus elgii TaxID=189691 RepID=UPI00167519BD|nr:hypothetical protein [Paenibacillus elgii]
MKQNKYDDVNFFSAYEKMKKCKDRSKDLKSNKPATGVDDVRTIYVFVSLRSAFAKAGFADAAAGAAALRILEGA